MRSTATSENNGLTRMRIRQEIYSRGVGAVFTAKDIGDAMTGKGIDIAQHIINSTIKRDEGCSLKVIGKTRTHGSEYKIIKIPASMKWVTE